MKTVEITTTEKISTLRDAIAKTIKGKQETIDLAIVTLLAEGHLLIEDVPGVGKTTLGHALARSLACKFHRIQFTSDLLPSDVLGVSVYSPKLNEFGYPDAAAEKEILKRFSNGNRHYAAPAVLDPTEVLYLQDESRKVHIDDSVVDYMIQIVNRTRKHPEIELGISPRGTAALFRATQAKAMVDGRSFVLPDDIKALAHPVFEHRLVLVRSGARARADAKTVLAEIIDQTPVPA